MQYAIYCFLCGLIIEILKVVNVIPIGELLFSDKELEFLRSVKSSTEEIDNPYKDYKTSIAGV